MGFPGRSGPAGDCVGAPGHDRRQGRRPRSDGRDFAAGMSGGVAYVYNGTARAKTTSTPKWSSSTPRRRRRRMAARHDPAHVDATDSAVGQRILTDWDERIEELHQGDAARLQAGAAGDRRGGTPARTSTRRSWRRRMPDPSGFLKYTSARPRSGGRSRCGCGTGKRSTRTSPTTRCASRRPAAWTAASRSATTAVRWAT